MDYRLTARRVNYFIEVLKVGSVRGAADVLGMDASAVSRAISMLEKECGVTLLERRGRGIVATDAGQLLAGYLRRQEEQKHRLLFQMESIQKMESGHIEITAGEGFIDWLMQRSLREFMTLHPKVSLTLDIGSSDEIVKRIVDERAHIGVLFQPPKDDRLRSHSSHPQPIMAFVHETHPLAAISRPLKLIDLAPYSGATVHQSFGVRRHIEAAEVSEGVRLTNILTTTSFAALGHFAASALGYALSTRLSLPRRNGNIVALPMKNPLLSQGRMHLVSRHGRMLSPVVGELLRLVEQEMSALIKDSK